MLYTVPNFAPSASGALQSFSSITRYRSTLHQRGAQGEVPIAFARALEATPTCNSTLPFRRGGFSSLCEALDYAALGETGFNFFDARGKLVDRLAYADLRIQARRFARRLIGASVGRGERLVIIADTWPGFCVAFFGAQYAGVLPVPVAVPVGLGSKNGYIEQLHRQIASSGAVGVVVPDEFVAFAEAAAMGTSARFVATVSTLETWPEARDCLCPFAGDGRCYVQFSSGSTRAPLGIDIRQDRLMANIDASIERQGLEPHDAGVSWLPLYHDMGLIGFLLAPMCAQRSVDLLAPRDFARRPLQWLSLISRRRATITYSPSFGYELVARRALAQPLGDIDLSCLELAGIGADMIRPDVLRRFAEAFASRGFDRRAFLPSYGMAEVCVGLSIGRRFEGFTTDRIGTREFVMCGSPLAEHAVEVRAEDGLSLGDGRIGRIFAKGPSVMAGYFQKPQETEAVLKDGWLDTGDLGYWRNGQLVVTGRAKDLIIVNGRNIWPQDIEWSVEALPRLRQGDACAFSVDGANGEEVVVLVQSFPAAASELETLTGDIRQVVKETAGVESRVVLISRQVGLPLTSSGKLSRSQAKVKFMAAAFEPLAPAASG